MLAQAFADLKKKIIAGTSFEQHITSDTNSSGTGSHGKYFLHSKSLFF